MLKFRLGQCSVELAIEPLSGSLALADRQLAWRTYLALVMQPELRGDQMPTERLRDLLRTWQPLLDEWPASQIERPSAGHLGFVLLTVVELIVLPAMASGENGWPAVRDFLAALARELAGIYGFVDPGASVPQDLLAEWRGRL